MIRSLFGLGVLIGGDDLCGSPVSADSAVDVKIERGQESVGGVLKKDFHPRRVLIMIEQGDDFSDQAGGGFKQVPG
jgi:hypothetical protein